jgi:hypothetical protein
MCAEASTVLRAVAADFFFNHELNTGFFLYIGESYQQLMGLSLLAIGYHT